MGEGQSAHSEGQVEEMERGREAGQLVDCVPRGAVSYEGGARGRWYAEYYNFTASEATVGLVMAELLSRMTLRWLREG